MDPATDWVASEGKTGLDFDGNDDVVSVSNFVFVLQSEVTVSWWMLLRTDTFASRFFYASDSFFVRKSAGGSATQVDIAFGGEATLEANLTYGAMFHFAVAYKQNEYTRIYKNGVQVSSTSSSASVNCSSLLIGNRPESGRAPDGVYDDFRIYNRALATSELGLLATRRGIAYERAPRRSYYVSAGAPPVENRRNNMLVGCGF
jgi:hypothetical protein